MLGNASVLSALGNQMKRRTFLQLIMATMMPRCGHASSSCPSSDLWYCPSVFSIKRELRSDFVESLKMTEASELVLSKMTCFKMYIEAINPGLNSFTDQELKSIVKICEANKLKVAIEVGGVRMSKGRHGPGSGRIFAMSELKGLSRWVQAGGTIDYLTLDNSVLSVVGQVYKKSPSPLGSDYRPSIEELITETSIAASIFLEAYPNVEVGITESLGYFYIEGGKNGVFLSTDATKVPRIELSYFLDVYISICASRGATIRHFHIDFGIEGVRHDGKNHQLNFERVAEAARIIKEKDLKAGIMIGSFDDFTLNRQAPADIGLANVNAVKNTIDFAKGLKRSNISFDTYLFDRWEPFPDRTGPVSDELSDLGLTYTLLKEFSC